MSDCTGNTRFDGKQVYRLMGPDPAVYDIRGKHLYKANSPRKAYEIRGNYVYRTYGRGNDLRPWFEIRGNRIYKVNNMREAIYEIREPLSHQCQDTPDTRLPFLERVSNG
jgi:hypothetical protein